MADETTHRPAHSLLRNHRGGHAPVNYVELFFDLVYVFAITQASHFLLLHPGGAGLLEGGLLFLAVWWAWVYTTWFANWANPDRVPVRLVLLVVMLASMIMAVAIPRAFAHGDDDMGVVFAASYCFLQCARTLFLAWAMGRDTPGGHRNMLRIFWWFAASAVFWFSGAVQHESGPRIGFWLVALIIEYLGPSAGFHTPGMGRSLPSDWNISGSHMAERCALFVIIALGEGIVVTGSSFTQLGHEPLQWLAFALAFVGSALMWWIYFDRGAARGAEHIEHHAEPGRIARNAFTYLHMPIVAGIVITAVADALLLADPGGPAPVRLILFQSVGLIVYIGGVGAFKSFSSDRGNFPVSHLAGLAAIVVTSLAVWFHPPSALAFVALTVAELAMIALWEWISFHGGWRERLRPG